jgi:ketosteroid isomerase-like protein
MDERLAILAPGLAVKLAILTRRLLRPSSPLRRALVARTLCLQYEGVNRRDFELVEIFYSPELECVYEHVQALPLDLPPIDRGRDAMRRWSQVWDEAWDDARATVKEVIDTSGDQMGTVVRVEGRGRGSGAMVEQELTEVFTLRDGLVVRFVVFADRAQGLALLESSVQAPEAVP